MYRIAAESYNTVWRVSRASDSDLCPKDLRPKTSSLSANSIISKGLLHISLPLSTTPHKRHTLPLISCLLMYLRFRWTKHILPRIFDNPTLITLKFSCSNARFECFINLLECSCFCLRKEIVEPYHTYEVRRSPDIAILRSLFLN